MSLTDFIIQVVKKKNVDNSKIRKILIIRNDHIGDVCLTLPVCALLKKLNENLVIHFLISEYAFDIAQGNFFIDKIITQKKSESINEIVEKLDNYDAVLNFCSTEFNANLCGAINASIKMGFAYKFYNILNCNTFIFKRRKNPPIHETDFCFEFAKNIFNVEDKLCAEAKTLTVINIDSDTKLFIDKYLSKFNIIQNRKTVAIHSGDNNSALNIRINQYIELAEILLNDFNVIFIFGPGETKLLDFFKDDCINKFSFVKGDLTLKQLCCLISKMDCLVSGSTGPMHIAGLMNTPSVSVFSNKPSHSFKKWHPINNKMRIIEPDIEYSLKIKNRIMEFISIEKLKNAVYEII